MPQMTRSRPKLSLRRAGLILAVALCAGLAFWMFGDLLNFETLRDNRETLLAWRDANYVLAVIAYMAAYMAVVAFSLPGGAIMTLTGGFLFGLIAGTIFTVLAATLGATAIFLAARFGLGDALYARLKDKSADGMLSRIERGLRENEINFLLVMRLVPAIPFFVANLAPAFLGVRLRNYVLTTFLGIIPGTAVYTWIGAGLGEVFARGDTPDLGLIFDPMILGPILGLAALAGIPILIKSLRRNRKT